MEKRTYQQAVELMVHWWIEKSFHTPLNQDNGDTSTDGLAFLLLNMRSMSAQQKNTPEKIEAFKEVLTKLLIEKEDKGRYDKTLKIDYHPNQILAEACQQSGIDSGCLPCKTFTFINDDNEIEGRHKYGGEWFKI